MGWMDRLLFRQSTAKVGDIPELTEVAIDSQNIFGIGINGLITNEDELVGRRGLRIYRDMEERDAQVKYSFQLKKHAALSVPVNIMAADLSETGEEITDEMNEEAERQARYVKGVFEHMNGTVKQFLFKVLNAIRDGYSVTEKNFTIIDHGEFAGMIGLESLKTHRADDFQFATDQHGNMTGIIQRSGFTISTPLDREKFIVYSHNKSGDDSADHYGRSDFRAAWRFYRSSDFIDRYWNVALEKYATPTAVGKVRRNERQVVRDQIFTILKKLQADTVAVLPVDDVDKPIPIDLLEAKRQVSADFKDRLEYCNKMIARSLLMGGDLATSAGEGTGSYAMSRVHFDVFILALSFVQEILEDWVLGDQLICQLIDLNFERPMYPTAKFEALIKNDRQIQANVIQMLVTAGIVNPAEPWVREFLQIPEKPENIELLPPKQEAVPFQDEDTADEFNTGENRKPNEFEKKVDFQAIQRRFQTLEEKTVSSLVAIIEDIGQKYIAKVERRRIIQDRKPAEIKKLGPMPRRSDMRKVIQDSFLFLFDQGKKDAGKEVGRKNLAATLAGSKLEGLLKDKAFGISGVIGDELLAQANQVLVTGLDKGFSSQKVSKQLGELFNSFAGDVTQITDAGTLMQPARLNTIIRTNFTTVYNQGRRELFFDPDLAGFISGVQYSAIIDSRTTPVCRSLDGKVFRGDDVENIERFTPPLHFNCRSILVPITKIEAEESPFKAINSAQIAKAESLVQKRF